jgi:hypothetical protein
VFLDGEAGHHVIALLRHQLRRSRAWLQRAANAQPRPSSCAAGTSPGISVSRVLAVFIAGIEAISARV